MWLQPDKVSCLKTLINTIISTFTDIQEFSLGCLFCFKNTKFTPKFTLSMIDGVVPEMFLYSQDLSSYTKLSLKYERFGIGGIHFFNTS